MRGLLNIETYRKLIWDTPEKELSRYRQEIGPIRWFILVWVGIVSLYSTCASEYYLHEAEHRLARTGCRCRHGAWPGTPRM